MVKAGLILAMAAIALGVGVAQASSVAFGDSWREQRFSLFSSNDFGLRGESLTVRSDGTVSLLWTRVPEGQWDARNAAWQWRVDESVPPTDLTSKGGDDRNLALYFVFLPEAVAERAQASDLKDLLDEPDVRVLMYVWGGDHPKGAILPTPYLGERGRTIIRRQARTGAEAESADLAADYEAAFGEPVQSLVGLAVSADSDDTDSHIKARISQLRLLP